MKVFELHFNPKLKKERLLDTFCYEPVNIEEKRKGNLYLVGELKNALPKNSKLIDNLAFQCKKEYYRLSKKSPEKSLTDSLKKLNSYLENLLKAGDTSWLGNLDFSILALIPRRNNAFWNLNFAKTGELKIFLSRGGKITDIGKSLTDEQINPYPLVYFGNIASGKLFPDDLLLVLSKEVFAKMAEIDSQTKTNLIEQISQIAPLNDFEQKLNELLEKKKEFLKEICGVSIFVLVGSTSQLNKRLPQILLFEKIKAQIYFFPVVKKMLQKFIIFLKTFLEKHYSKNFRFLSKFLQRISQKFSKKISQNTFLNLIFKKHLILIILFVFILLLGLIIF